MGKVIGEIIIRASAEKAWGFMTDPDHFPDWIDGYDGGKVLTPDKTGVGAAFEWYGKLGPIKLKSAEEVVEWAPEGRVAYEGTMFGVTFKSSMEIKDEDDSVKVFVSIDYQVPSALGGWLSDRLFLKKMIQSYVDRSISNLKSQLERPGNDPK